MISLKAWLAAPGLTYPRFHDANELKRLLQDGGQDVIAVTPLMRTR